MKNIDTNMFDLSINSIGERELGAPECPNLVSGEKNLN